MAELAIEGLRARHGRTEVLAGVDLVVPNGTLVAVLGASGCGKTTLLRTVAGHHRPSGGRVLVDGEEIAGPTRLLPPEARSIGLVPQEGALFPHLDVRANIAFGLRGRRHGIPRSGPEVDARVAELLDLVGLAGLERRRPHQLSGGQQQRVAVARALAPGPKFVLLDEPFSALDARVREEVRAEVRTLVQREGSTAVLVTHDQDEAFSIADLVAVMRGGRVVQYGTPHDIYRRPFDADLARFVGPAVIVPVDQHPFGEVEVDPAAPATGDLLLRPEQLRLVAEGVPGRVVEVRFHGASTAIEVELDGGQRYPVRVVGTPPALGERVGLAVTGTAWRVPV